MKIRSKQKQTKKEKSKKNSLKNNNIATLHMGQPP